MSQDLRGLSSSEKLDAVAQDIARVAVGLGLNSWELKRGQYLVDGGVYSGKQIDKLGGYNSIVKTYFLDKLDNASKLRLNDVRKNQRALDVKLGSKDIFFEELDKVLKDFPQ